VPAVGPEDPGFGRAVPCTCRAAELEARRHDQLMQMSQLGALTESTFNTFIPEGHGLNEAKRRNLRIAFETAQTYAHQPNGWLVLKGGYGCGKTHLAAAIANHRLAEGEPVLFVNTPDLLDHLRSAYSPNAETGYDARFDQVRNAPLLVLDDLGTQSNTEWAQEKLYQIFNYRYNARLPTVITTNAELESLEPRIRSRVVDPSLVQVVHILAHDFRGTGIGKDHSDLSTLNLHGDKTFDNFDVRESELPRAESDNLRRALQTARDFAADPHDWLVFNSIAYGNGKTHLAASHRQRRPQSGQASPFRRRSRPSRSSAGGL
jgi:DNA replication protein DnaC